MGLKFEATLYFSQSSKDLPCHLATIKQLIELILEQIYEGNEQQDLPYYNNADSITLYWIHNDTVSGIRETYFSLGTGSMQSTGQNGTQT